MELLKYIQRARIYIHPLNNKIKHFLLYRIM